MFISGSRSHWRGVKNLEVSLNNGAIAWTRSGSGSRSDETTIFLEARSADGSGGRLEETKIFLEVGLFISGSRSHWRGVKNLEVYLKTGDIAWTGSRSGARSDETKISLEARSADVPGGRLEETKIGSRSGFRSSETKILW